MKHVWKMLMAAVLCLSLLLPVAGAAEDAADRAWGVCTADNVRVRKQPSTKANMWFYIDEGFVAEILGTVEDDDGDVAWYKVNSTHPNPNGRTYIGYVHGDFFRPLTEKETEAYLKEQGITLPTKAPTEEPTATPTAEPEEEPTMKPSIDDVFDDDVEYTEFNGTEVTGVTATTLGITNFRSEPSTKTGKIITTIPAWKTIDVSAIPLEDASEPWYRVRYDGRTGYVHGGMIKLNEEVEETATPDPGFGTEVTDTIGTITADGVRFRAEPNTNAEIYAQLDEGDVVEILTVPEMISSKHWYRVRYGGKVGYIQSNYIRVNKDEPTEAPTEEPTPTPTAVPVDPDDGNDAVTGPATGMITADGVNFRVGPGTKYDSMGKLNADMVVELLSIPDVIDADHWYRVRYNGHTGYIQAPFIRILTANESDLPDPGAFGYARLKKDYSWLREEPAGSYIIKWTGKGSLMRIIGEPAQAKGFNWYPVFNDKNSTMYYVRGDQIEIVQVEADDSKPTATPLPESEFGYVITTDSNVNLRLQPGGEVITQVPEGVILPLMAEPSTPKENGTSYTWFFVMYEGMYGYLRGDYVRLCTATGGEIAPTPTPSPEPTPTSAAPETYGYIKLIKTGVNLRVKPLGNSQVQLPKGMILPVTGAVVPAGEYGKYCWYPVRTADGLTGYIRGDCAEVCDYEGEEVTPTPSPTPTATPTPEPEQPEVPEQTEQPAGLTGKMVGNTNFREGPSTSSKIITVIKKGTLVDVLALPEAVGSTWYLIIYDGTVGYVHANLLDLVEEAPTPTPEPSVEPTPSMEDVDAPWVRITHNKVNLRESYSQDSDRLYQVNKDTVMTYLGYKQIGGVRWYNAIYRSDVIWVHGDYAEVMTMAEYTEWAGEAFDTDSNRGYLKLTSDKVYIRNAAGGTTIIDQLAKNTIVRYYSEDIAVGDYRWYLILTPGGALGYIRTDMVEVCDQYGEPLPTTTPNLGDLTSAPDSQQETSYSRLKLGDSGVKVTNLVNELINQGYYKGKATSNYTSEVQAAVKAFQAVKGLTVDGIAGDLTQHALFGTQPIGSGDTSNLDFAIYPVEKIDWFDGGIQQMIPRGSNFKVYDVKTGIVWWAHRWAGAYHADIETLTAADSARLCEIYGVKNLAEIVKENMWHRRPCLVTIGTRTFACSLDGMQHGTDTIANNGMDGQICLHFTNSTGHAAGAGVSTSHKEAIEYAYNHCPAGQK